MVVSSEIRRSALRSASIIAVANTTSLRADDEPTMFQLSSCQKASLLDRTPILFYNLLNLASAKFCECESKVTLQHSQILPKYNVPNSCSSTRSEILSNIDKKQRKTTYDFIVVGCGNAGTMALETLRSLCPNAKIAVVDPVLDKRGKAKQFNADYWHGRAVSLNSDQSLEIEEIGTDDVSIIAYRQGVLIATGSRGAPPPHYLVDERCGRQQVLELRPTMIENTTSEIVSTDTILKATVTGTESICVLGSGWEAMELVARATLYSHRGQRPSLVMGCHGPVSRVLPPYLSTALSKRFKSKGVVIFDRSLVRYISQTKDNRLQIYTAKSYDFLEGDGVISDKVIIAPDVNGSRGTAVLPTEDVPDFLLASAMGRPWYQSWSHISPRTLTCYQDDGRIAVNAELSAASTIFAAGSVAKFPNYRTGNASVAGNGIHDATQAGLVAATNMARQYWRSRSVRTFRAKPLVKDSIPVWTSDSIFPGTESALHRIGIQALCVGHCDSESLATHGIWWTNQAAQRRILSTYIDNNGNDLDDHSVAERKRVKECMKFVYGLGVVFYHDGNGRIHGIMTWGLPTSSTGETSKLNRKLIKLMKDIITTNGGFRSLISEQDSIRMSKYLETKAKEMICLAYSKSTTTDDSHQLGQSVGNLPRPLHRLTEIKPASLRSLGFHRRKDGRAHGVAGENMFSREENDDLPDIPILQPSSSNNLSAAAAAKVQAFYNWNVWEQTERRWEENETRARPPKEDPLWIRKGDETRNMTHKDRLASAYSVIFGTPGSGG